MTYADRPGTQTAKKINFPMYWSEKELEYQVTHESILPVDPISRVHLSEF